MATPVHWYVIVASIPVSTIMAGCVCGQLPLFSEPLTPYQKPQPGHGPLRLLPLRAVVEPHSAKRHSR
ncbi:hypothetical protein [Pantoea ananatis]|uniref:hypothetical protein n=1 Tax=Pantoea ananas TaxID=553 RepID=UPI000B0518A8|nr:hypothetical protein [Pantoea ananatis]